MIDILYQDNRIIVCVKPAGILSTDEPGGLPDLLRKELGQQNSCIRTVHRLDQVVGGVMVLARSREAARRLSAQMQGHGFRKEYLAIVHGIPDLQEATLNDLLIRDKATHTTHVTDMPGKDVREAVLSYHVISHREGLSLLKVNLYTGRTHQIRAQLSAHGWPIYGDHKYGAKSVCENGIALWSYQLSFIHPQTEAPLTFYADTPQCVPWTLFQGGNQ